MAVQVKDRGYDAFRKTFEELGRALITVGIHEDLGSQTHDGAGMSVAEIAERHEFGLDAPIVPRRSFIAGWFDEKKAENIKVLKAQAEAALKARKAKPALDRAGLFFVGSIQKRIADGISPENAPSTIAKKGSSTPLVDTGQLRQSIRHKVRL